MKTEKEIVLKDRRLRKEDSQPKSYVYLARGLSSNSPDDL